MHELTLAESILAIVSSHLREAPGRRPKVIRLDIGALSHVDADTLRRCFEIVARGSVAGDARLEITRRPGRAWCHDCARAVPLEALGAPCPDCGGHGLRIEGGDELRVREMEVD